MIRPLSCKDIESLKENIMIINKFAEISGLKLNKKKTKAIWIGSQKKNKTKPLAIDITNEPTKHWESIFRTIVTTKTFSSKFKKWKQN